MTEGGRAHLRPYQPLPVAPSLLHEVGEVVVHLFLVAPDVDVGLLPHPHELVQYLPVEPLVDPGAVYALVGLSLCQWILMIQVSSEVVRGIGHYEVDGLVRNLLDELVAVSEEYRINVHPLPSIPHSLFSPGLQGCQVQPGSSRLFHPSAGTASCLYCGSPECIRIPRLFCGGSTPPD